MAKFEVSKSYRAHADPLGGLKQIWRMVGANSAKILVFYYLQSNKMDKNGIIKVFRNNEVIQLLKTIS